MKVVVLLCCGERKVKEEKCLFTSSGRGFILAGLKNLIDMIDSFNVILTVFEFVVDHLHYFEPAFHQLN